MRRSSYLDNMADYEIYLNKRDTIIFLNLYESHPCLWDASLPEYKNKICRRKALEMMATAMGADWTIKCVTKKINCLRTYYNRERQRELAFNKTGEPGHLYQSHWIYYEQMKRMLRGDEYQPDDSILNGSLLQSASSRSEVSEYNTDEEKSGSLPLADLFNGSASAPTETKASLHYASKRPFPAIADQPQSSGPGRVNTLAKKSKNTLTNSAVRTVKATSSLPVQDFRAESAEELYGRLVASKLRSIKNEQRKLIVQHEIDNLLHAALLAEMNG